MLFTKKTPRPVFKTPPKRILIVKPSAIGDVVHAIPDFESAASALA